MQYRIGEFSRITGLTIKALRLYHEEGIIVPDYIDEDSGYRYYDESKVREGILISQLREMGFLLPEVSDILKSIKSGKEDSLVGLFEKRLKETRMTIRREKEKEKRIRMIISSEFQNVDESGKSNPVIDDFIGPWIILSHRFKGRYRDVGKHFTRLYRMAGKWVSGPPGSLYYDGEYREEDADIECFVTLSQSIVSSDPVYATVREIPEQRSLSTIHAGPYEKLGSSYERLFREINNRGLVIPPRTGELYLKGPGIFFRGNPERYRTKIFIPLSA